MSRASSRPPSPPAFRTLTEIRARRRGPGLTADDWADAALWSLVDGVDALSVERLARALGVTKGSLYWHFEGREALLRAALARWEQLATGDVIRRLEQLPTPRERLSQLLSVTFEPGPVGRIEVAIAAAAANPLIQPVLARVSRRRIDYVVALYREMGLSSREARSWALQAYSTYVGLLHLAIASPDTLRSARERADYLQHLSRALMPP
ncbi:TetR/AcrR family transcriptional regulator [Myxococcus sp. K38C18041901]|uniref:TetR/AcrR family transcriptional regulator n=1 Tax=Myxococcus guangdongensis TaxID=2906760 RepID=UPI0020A701D4|nr:TetR/AcrR family transcriptional regulator [Myxococcus guangdongensis]MCP3058421.1 TetR/AcrR family transcriptional regulator [Myxococcus guangdongensis]